METYTLTFTLEEMKVIDKALGELPFKDAAPLIANINKQINESITDSKKS